MGNGRKRETGPVLPGLVIALAVTTLVLMRDPSATGHRFRELLNQDDQRLAEVVRVPGGQGSYEFSMTQRGSDEPVSYNPCRPIEYVINPVGGPANGTELIESAIGVVSDATGFRFRYEGTSNDRAFESRTGMFGAAPVLFGWATETEIPRLADDVSGLGGSAAEEQSPGRRVYVTGMVVLDREDFEDLARRPDGEAQQRAVVVHELGHVVGLAHVDDPAELMYDSSTGQTALGPGDREGLAQLGAVPCG